MKKPAVSFLIPVKDGADFIANSVTKVHHFLDQHYNSNFEIILIVNGPRTPDFFETLSVCHHLENEFSQVKVITCHGPIQGKGIALKEGYLASRGQNIFFTDGDLPFNLNFFEDAQKQLDSGYDFVFGNRRRPDSFFNISVSILPFVYSRHRVGVLFNQVVRHLFGLKSRDTQAGIKAMTRAFAKQAFFTQTCAGFLFDIEFFLAAERHGFKSIDLPVQLHFNTEKSTVVLLKELARSIYWLSKIRIQMAAGLYDHKANDSFTSQQAVISADDWGLDPAVNRGILNLAQKGIITRVSILSEAPAAIVHLDELMAIPDMKIGMHFNLTRNSFYESPTKLLAYLFSPAISFSAKKRHVERRFREQLDKFQNLFSDKRLPHYVDGHHHAHVFPIANSVFCKMMKQHGIKETRLPFDREQFLSSKFLIPLFSYLARKRMRSSQLEYLPFCYPPAKLMQNSAHLQAYLADKAGHEVIVHPGLLPEQPRELDTIRDQRLAEYRSLSHLLDEHS
jgi:predicted glycoside hydrolase/deacetylase ChbG (UPF0249 family)/glycosyltransferase involved in cell wall biosynthesis